jgi:hypothetical protein
MHLHTPLWILQVIQFVFAAKIDSISISSLKTKIKDFKVAEGAASFRIKQLRRASRTNFLLTETTTL